ncbi:PilZ domain-containing protein [Sphingorhabdus sp.]|uniref:PilZ domain-containing protein n=1 Tax=Sphingorhabdus sp. TaxID=1902408 RepID=UPI00391B98F0
MALHQRKAQIETSVDNRRRRRHKLFLEVQARGPASVTDVVIVHDISDTGLLIETDSKLKVGEMIEVNLPQAGLMEAEIVWIGGQIYGCRFVREITPAAISAARLGGRFTISKSDNVVEMPTVAAPANNTQHAQPSIALTGELSLGAKLWIIIGLASSLWIIIGGATYWTLA